MAIKNLSEIIESARNIIGENTSDEALSFMEDLSDTMTDFDNKTKDATNWQERYQENDAKWRKKYADRFNGKPVEEEEDMEVMIDSIRGSLSDGPIIMNAIRDSETGEMVASDVISASRVTARFRNVAERAGYVTIGFDITVPAEMADSRWQLKVRPKMFIQSDTVDLEPVYITGSGYRAAQLRG